ncbi:hypothetical protein [Desulfosudis oleivorans]|uniref:Uncharacterized protein n=1 Tax=Desulfosudis oleivorans (strain DSM 6200 / JCM 39069 / Hxd3) TaxID=96561 RepID=A8ZZS1_DESOH|nr:hypothetical protein [Desulfosudis oleivorans]ABW68943.1 conserved hypothetical protein [Desulfosudis oleivorans Hxd3]
MKCDKGTYIGQITSGIDVPSTLALKTISFINQNLPAWRDDPDRPKEQSEDKLNLQLCKFLDSRARRDFPMVRFDHEEYQTGIRRVDLSASPVEKAIFGAITYTIYDPILVIEGKRLPAPSTNREKEYVIGDVNKKNGGIERFKLGLHGFDLNIAVIVGYVQEKRLDHWYQKINEWILELADGTKKGSCVWNTDEVLKQLMQYRITRVSSCQSTHSRTGSKVSSEIKIHHLWIAMDTT